jgi:hypothetical protein
MHCEWRGATRACTDLSDSYRACSVLVVCDLHGFQPFVAGILKLITVAIG